MKILSAEQIRQVDRFTIEHDKISSHDLMERAAGACCDWIECYIQKDKPIWIFCGPGNNGGDGLAIARILFKSAYTVKVYLTGVFKNRSDDFLKNLALLNEIDSTLINELVSENDFPFIPENVLLVDALFGTGLSKPIEGLTSKLISYLNESPAEIIAIDLPSGLFADKLPEPDQVIIKASHTLSFQLPKFSFLFPSAEQFVGEWHILKIGLNQHFIDGLSSDMNFLTIKDIQSLIVPRTRFSHKGTYGHALLISGSKGKMGAAVMASRACLRSGSGLLTVHVPACGSEILQTTVPEAMVRADRNEESISEVGEISNYSAIGIGPGTGTGEDFIKVLESLLKNATCPLILDADALNSLAQKTELLDLLPSNSILTPHVKEFERLSGISKSDTERHEKQIAFSKKYNVIVILKGANSCITYPDGKIYFNSTGNSGMAKGGSGDVLTGILLGLVSQGYSSLDSSCIGVFLHGLAGDIAKEKHTEYAMTAMDLVESMGEAFRKMI